MLLLSVRSSSTRKYVTCTQKDGLQENITLHYHINYFEPRSTEILIWGAYLQNTIYSVLLGHDAVLLGNPNLMFVKQCSVFTIKCWTLHSEDTMTSQKNGIPQLHHYKNLTTMNVVVCGKICTMLHSVQGTTSVVKGWLVPSL